jgi:membrane protein DedA with SNARE-associated domain/rhodanese-related sulfurtransferase
MDLHKLLGEWGIGLVFAFALAEQAGLPLPAAPLLVAAGALAQDGALRPELVVLAAVGASVIADHAWYAAGRLRGRALLAGICRVSLSPDTCVSNAEALLARHGARLLLVAKFIPGVSAVAIPMVAARGIPYSRFVLYDTAGAFLWCSTYIGAGMIFSREVHHVLDRMALFGGWSLTLVAVLVASYAAVKAAHRYRLRRLYRLVRLAPGEAAPLLARDELVVVDARTHAARELDARRIPGSVTFDEQDLEALVSRARGRTIATFCTCPNEASAAILAERLIKAGYGRVRVLSGGEEALRQLAAPQP